MRKSGSVYAWIKGKAGAFMRGQLTKSGSVYAWITSTIHSLLWVTHLAILLDTEGLPCRIIKPLSTTVVLAPS